MHMSFQWKVTFYKFACTDRRLALIHIGHATFESTSETKLLSVDVGFLYVGK